MKVRFALFFLFLLLLPWLLKALGSYAALGSYILIWGLAAMGLNLLMGYAGQVSFGHAAFLGLGAYGAGLTLKHLAPSTPLALLLGTLLAALAALLLGPLVVRLKGIYFATFTIVFSQLFYFLAFQWNEVTGGDDGLRGFARQDLHLLGLKVDLTASEAYYYFVLAVFLLLAYLLWRTVDSPLGRAFLALRENPLRARFLGLKVERYLLGAFVLSGAAVGAAGALLAMLINFAQPSMLHWSTSGELVMMAFLGGRYHFFGPLLGAALFRVMEEVLSSVTKEWMLFLGSLFILAVLFFPGGLADFLRRWAWNRR
ncbi:MULTISPECIES: branched-chain amino acid ABC transporter permease [Thermus]|uniref:Branched-chain amino acid ABC transporter permease n=4 Tax=Thermus scotoductus TaxID=37636 RepID=A0A430QVL1_THESC|nr:MULTISPECIES: branched-chain amino acid ABC transporter permease [Thermus]RTG98993.1 branched-chain amino acid ABC transporter permease [Thermus scotoductus]RTH19693.1 branched-chain amino acid ABC transporter permease [Thermus scotoductus]BDG23539.1 branched-chain amino acid ABC transporter permease [Thermus thermophilus]